MKLKVKKNITDYNYHSKKVIIRCDLNVPIINGKITDDTRIKESLHSIKYLIQEKAKVIILSHLGKIKTEEDKKENTLYPVYLKLQKLLDTKVYFSRHLTGIKLEEKINNLLPGEVLLIENTRYMDIPDKLESNCDEELSKYWASLGDIFINDAYATAHRTHSSNVGIAKYLPSALGFLMEKEVTSLEEMTKDTTHPFVVIMGGKKISDKTLVIDNLIKKCDYLLLGGGMCFTFLNAKNINVGSSIIDKENLAYCQKILSSYSHKIILPIDIVTKDNQIKDINNLKDNDIGYDIGPRTIIKFKEILSSAKRVIINGPMGVFEESDFSNGTKEIYNILKEKNIKTLIGGGDSAASVNLLGFKNCFYHISTGGGATLEYLSGKKLPGIEIINDK